MKEKCLKAIAKFNMIKQGDRVVVALSGGADSIALAHLLKTLENELEITVFAAHFNHGLRGAQADRDEEFTLAFCEKLGIPINIGYGNMASGQKPQHLGEEAWARKLRYAFLDSEAIEKSAKVATAHTLSDNAETVIFNAARGAGTKGLSGIPPAREGYIRPLIYASRQEVEAYCKENSLDYVTDETNFSMKYSRNRIRHRVISQLEKAHPGTQNALSRLSDDMRILDAWLEENARGLLKAAAQPEGYSATLLQKAPQPVLLKTLYILAGTMPDRNTLGNMEKVLFGKLAALQLSQDKMLVCKEGILEILDIKHKAKKHSYKVPLQHGEILLPGGYFIKMEISELSDFGIAAETAQKLSKGGHVYFADYDKIPKDSFFRTRCEKDAFSFPKRNVTKTLKKWMSEEKLSEANRNSLPLLASEHRVIWIWNVGFCTGVEVDKTTKKLLALNIKKQGEEVNGNEF